MDGLVCSNGFYGGYIATKHLLQKGYARPAILVQRLYSITLERYFGYAAAIMEAGLSLNRRHVILDGNDHAGREGYDEVKALLSLDTPPDSIFCTGERLLEGTYKALQDAGLRISDDIGIISHDNSVACLRCFPQTTAVAYPSYESGYKAAEILYDMMNGKAMVGVNVYIQHPALVERESCLGPKPGSVSDKLLPED